MNYPASDRPHGRNLGMLVLAALAGATALTWSYNRLVADSAEVEPVRFAHGLAAIAAVAAISAVWNLTAQALRKGE